MGSSHPVIPCEDAIGGFKIYNMITLDKFLKIGAVHVKVGPSSFFFLKGCDHVKVSSNQPERVSSLVVEIRYAI